MGIFSLRIIFFRMEVWEYASLYFVVQRHSLSHSMYVVETDDYVHIARIMVEPK